MKLLLDIFTTKLGRIELSVETDSVDEIQKIESELEATDFQIELRKFKLDKFPLPQNLRIKDSCGWQIFLRKKNDKPVDIKFECKLVDPNQNTDYGYASGENLDAIEFENDSYHLHIGTEDGEAMKNRAENTDWLPYRLKDFVSIENPITRYTEFGFLTPVPQLKKDEHFYSHYLVAGNDKLSSEHDISTWLLVEQSKKDIEQYGW